MADVTTFNSVTTASSGATWVTLPAQGCSVVTIHNLTGVDLKVRRAAATTKTITVKNGVGMPLAVANANELQIRRADSSNTQVTAELLID